MSKNIKLGDNTLLGVQRLKVENADTAGAFDYFDDTTDANAVASDILDGKTGYVNGVKITGSITTKTSSDLTASGATVTAPAGYYATDATKTIASGTEGTPTATKGTVSNHSIAVTPSVTNAAGYIEGGTKTGTAVNVSASELVNGNINLTNTSSTDVTNYATAQIVDANLTAANIAKDVTVLGITGTHEGGITPTGNIDITTTSQVDVTNYATAQVVDADLIASNIKKDVNILGVTGTYEAGGVTPTGNQDISTLNEYDVTTKATARVSAAERAKIIPQNIANGITILGIEGTHQGGGTPTGNINITTTERVNVADYETAQVVDADLIPQNIRKNINILGIVGSYEGGGGVTPTGSINITTNGTYDVTEYASAVVAIPSAEGYSITTNLTGGTSSGSTATFGSPNTAQVTLTASSGYVLPTSISVTGADSYYNNSTGVVTLTNATGNITITAVFRKSYTITGNITNGSLSGATAIIENGTAYVTLTPSTNYYTPAAISVAGASFTYDFTSGQIYLSNPTENVEINATCIQPYTITGNITNGTMSGDSTILDGRTGSVTITPNSSFVTPNSVTVTNADYNYNVDTGVISLSNAVGNIVITATCVAAYTITGNITNGSLTGDSIIGVGRTATVTIVGSSGYTAPEESAVTVTNATIASYSGGKITLSNPTGNVTVTATCVEALVNKGDIINIDMTGSGTPQQYRVIKSVTSDVVEVFSMADVSTPKEFSYSNNIYEGGRVDGNTNTTWYNTLSTTAKNALVAKTFTQDSWYLDTSGNPVYQCKYYYQEDMGYQRSLGNATYGNEITRNVYILSMQDIIDYLGVTPEMTAENTTFTNNNIWQMFWNDTSSHNAQYLWLRSAQANDSKRALIVMGDDGTVNSSIHYSNHRVRAAFQIDLTKISWTK